MPPRKKSRKASEKPQQQPRINIAEMTQYEIQRMNNCLRNNDLMRGLGLPVDNAPFADFGQDEHNIDCHPSDDNVEPEKDDSLQELDTSISSLFADKTAKEVTKRGSRKAQPHNQAGTLRKSNAKKASATEISNQTTEEAEADAAQQNGCQSEGENNTLTGLNQDGSTENGMDLEEDLFAEQNWIRGPNIGRKLDKLTRSRKGKFPLVIEPGRIRPTSETIASKFSTECNIAVRHFIPIFPHWKEYKKKSSLAIFIAFRDRVCSKFDTDKTSPHVKRACLDMMQRAVRQQRHKLKKKYFDDFPLQQVPKKSPVSSMTDVQWDTLVESWKSEKKMLTCEKNKDNRRKVQFHQATGSRSYEIQLLKLESKYQNEPANALDKFKDLHYSKKKGFTPAVQSAIVEMEDKINASVNDGEEPKDVADVVSEVLVQKTNKKNSFLINAGIKSSSASEDNAKSELQAELIMEKQTSSDLRELVNTQKQQMDELMKRIEEGEAARARKDEENEKRQAESDALIRRMLSMIPTSRT